MRKHCLTLTLAVLTLLGFGRADVAAQGVTTGAITGTVTDPAGQPLPGVEVRVVNRETGYNNQTLTRSNGVYLIQGLEVGGPYSVTISSLGYADVVRADVFVRLSQATRVDAQLTVQAVQLQALDVTVARTADFTATRQGIAVQVSDTLVSRVPTFSRDFIDLVKLAPQVVYPASGAASGAGAYNRYNTITVDGANQSERFNLGSTGGVPGGSASGKVVSMDAVKEFAVMFTPTDVRQGNFAGMLINAVTKSGTNQLRGGANFTYRSNEDVLGLSLVGEDLRASEFQVQQYGFHLGGPIIRDRLHFFIAPELQQRTRPAGGPFYTAAGQPSPVAPAVPLDSLNRIAQIMRTNYNFDVGATGPVDNNNPLTNLFARLDFQASPEHRLVLRQIYNRSEDDSFSRNINSFNANPLNQNSGFRFSSNQFSRVAANSSTVAQLYSNLARGMSNELILGYSTIRDERKVPVQAPEIAVGVHVGSPVTIRAVTFGTEQFSPGNLLEQNIFELVNNFTIPRGAHTLTFGGRFDHTKIFNNFAQGSFGVYTFPTIAALAAGAPGGYAVGYANSRNDADIPADFRVQVYSLYGQDHWSVTDRFTITAGLRADIPRFLDRPSQNDTITNLLAAAGLPGVRTDAVPSTQVMWSPRLGFNWDPTGDQVNQIRGGMGIFTGPPPYILLGNAYSNTGLGLVRMSCTGANTPAFTLDVTNLPTACANQQPPAAGQAGTAGINTVDPNFKFPQYFGVSAGLDRRLPFATVLTVEGLYRRAINGVLVRDRNIRGPRMVGNQPYTDVHGRVLYADTFAANHAVTNVNQRYVRTVRGVNFNEGVIDVTNQSEDYNWSISSQLNRRFSDRFEATLAYTHMRSQDVQGLTSDRAISNWRNARQLHVAHEDLQTTTSVFSRPHRVLAYGTYTMPWARYSTDVTLYYEGSSGSPLVYVAGGTNGDLNGDGYAGNDPLYIPRNALDINEIRIGTGVGNSFVQNVAAAEAFDRFISSQDCLNRQRGSIMERNSCRSPFQHRMDLSLRQAVPTFRGQQVGLQLDVFNMLNLLNNDWGQNRLPTLSPTFPDQRALLVTGRNPGPINQSLPTFTFDNRLYQSNADLPGFGDPLPFQGRQASVYQIQLTLRYNF
jgi:outer membrane receptor protein involved in Fe transport